MIRKRVMALEQELVDGIHASSQAKSNIKKIQALLKLQKAGTRLRTQAPGRVEPHGSGARVAQSGAGHEDHRAASRDAQIALRGRKIDSVDPVQTPDQERWEAPAAQSPGRARGPRDERDRSASNRSGGCGSARAEHRATKSSSWLTCFMIWTSSRAFSSSTSSFRPTSSMKRHQERVAQLENYQKLKSAENQVEDLIQNFNSRVELERATETETSGEQGGVTKKSHGLERRSPKLRGQLKLPVSGGKILTHYGRAFDSKSGLYRFQEGRRDRNRQKTAGPSDLLGESRFLRRASRLRPRNDYRSWRSLLFALRAFGLRFEESRRQSDGRREHRSNR